MGSYERLISSSLDEIKDIEKGWGLKMPSDTKVKLLCSNAYSYGAYSSEYSCMGAVLTGDDIDEFKTMVSDKINTGKALGEDEIVKMLLSCKMCSATCEGMYAGYSITIIYLNGKYCRVDSIGDSNGEYQFPWQPYEVVGKSDKVTGITEWIRSNTKE